MQRLMPWHQYHLVTLHTLLSCLCTDICVQILAYTSQTETSYMQWHIHCLHCAFSQAVLTDKAVRVYQTHATEVLRWWHTDKASNWAAVSMDICMGMRIKTRGAEWVHTLCDRKEWAGKAILPNTTATHQNRANIKNRLRLCRSDDVFFVNCLWRFLR